MRTISNSDYAFIVKCLHDYVGTPDGGDLRKFNRRRLARVLLNKFMKHDSKGNNREVRKDT